MQDLILYHYSMSPFAEKMRAMLGYTGIPWQSVTVREMPPRKVLSILAGGYRKVPVAQIGADVFCDTRVISDELARISGRPELSLDGQPQEILDFVRKADLEIFFACVMSASDKNMLKKLIKETSLWNAFLFLKDRMAMGKTSRVRTARGPKAKAVVLEHMAAMEQMLTSDFLFSDQPTIADFSAYHGLWFVTELGEKPWIEDYPKVKDWLARMKAFGHGSSQKIGDKQGLDTAKAASPRALASASEDPLTGQRVTVAPDDYGRDPVKGTLVFADDRRIILSRSHKRVGEVHVHFPRQGFTLEAAEASQ
ncbi:glutathione S-transferase family protein [Marinobacter confluentis]|uniref:Glutathione S-transferase family protein n=1 Tax=Marinobacter confluentis TaxID=1697557 RepID=A0A4Z1BSH0_9GAMM|nr:glutathione S-transferase family protein [Marinobacter confluentis]TGN40169.1 glutathione S-transferase family protein [Marinobacter confluentis]